MLFLYTAASMTDELRDGIANTHRERTRQRPILRMSDGVSAGCTAGPIVS